MSNLSSTTSSLSTTVGGINTNLSDLTNKLTLESIKIYAISSRGNMSSFTLTLPSDVTSTGQYQYGLLLLGWSSSSVSAIPFKVSAGSFLLSSNENHSGLTLTTSLSGNVVTITSSSILWGGVRLILFNGTQ